ncbi:glycosyltransferase family 2 protein [Glaciecola sp. 2405UD65-10]|uniref:glycosyltransferase family 2 protein n=1 Tax=Glaciecola sp. 2405UD65-10 TaxID=3397244 RepID=UPI003B5CE291
MTSTHIVSGFTVSAVIPMYNGEQFIALAIASILAQTHPVNEIIVIDDGSTDNGVSIVNDLANSGAVPIKIYKQSNTGVSGARNLGLIKSSCDLIAFLDVDDTWAPTKIETQIAVYKQRNDATLFTFTDYYIDDELEKARKFVNSKNKKFLENSYGKKEFQIAFIQENFVGTASTVIFNRELALKINGFNIHMNHSEDFDFILRYSNYADVVCVNQALATKVFHGDNLTGDLFLHYWSHMFALQNNIIFNSKYTRYNYSKDVVNEMRYSYDEYLIRYCNEVFEKSSLNGIKEYFLSISKLKSGKGAWRFSMAFGRKLLRFITAGYIKRKW